MFGPRIVSLRTCFFTWVGFALGVGIFSYLLGDIADEHIVDLSDAALGMLAAYFSSARIKAEGAT